MIDRTGQRFGRLVVLASFRLDKRTWASCRCDCGVHAEVVMCSLVTGATQSCGCLHSEISRSVASQLHLDHGHARSGRKTPEYKTWCRMITRCENPKHEKFPYYGGRGISVCARWRHDFKAFLADVGLRPSAAHSIDRYPDNNGHYEPGNVRWATRSKQMQNRRPLHRDARGRVAGKPR